ncbi:hypothetical protein AGMMS49938_04900 [Fibrobacterales bacterium]|nr:hypothetical protein AGMMS49938_04900 [Fibrobacterales bacterium]
MNISKFLFSGLFVVGSAFAQLPWENSSSSAEETTTPPPSYEATSNSSSSAIAPQAETIFDQVRGLAYNPYGTVGAASNVADLATTPSDIYGKKFAYLSPSDFVGFTAFNLGGGSALLGLGNNYYLSELTLGYATGAFGLAVKLSIAKAWISDDNFDVSERRTGAGDNVDLYFSIPISIGTLYARGGWLTNQNSYSSDRNGDEYGEDYSSIEAQVGLTGKLSSLNYDAYLGFLRTGGTLIDDGDKAVDENTYTAFSLNFNIGYQALANERARVLVGLNTSALGMFYDEVENIGDSDSQLSLTLSPNILAEVALFDNLLAFGGATHSLVLFGGDLDRNDDTSLFGIVQSPTTQAFAGLRWQKDNWALEAQVAANPFEAFNGNNIFANFGGFIYF